MATQTPSYGEQPLAQTVAAAGAIRRLSGLLLSLEHEHPTVDAMLEQIGGVWERELAAAAPTDPSPRIGPPGANESQRVYLDHAFDIGAYNPAFPPEYTFDELGEESASGRVTFPVLFEVRRDWSTVATWRCSSTA